MINEFRKKTLNDIKVNNKRVLMRADYNVPLDDMGNITDDKRIVESLPTVQQLCSQGAALIICSHMGRPKGKRVDALSLKPVYNKLKELLPHTEIFFSSEAVGEEPERMAAELKPGQILLLENLRYYPGEEKNDPEFAAQLAKLAEIFVSDAFGTVHRAHASTVGVAKLLPTVCGYLIEKELRVILGTVANPTKPFVVVLGGAKVDGKIGVIDNLLPKCDTLLIGGAMAYTFLRAQGFSTGTSLVSEEHLDLAKGIMERAALYGVKLLLPTDIVVTSEFSPYADHKNVDISHIPDDMMGMDIGENTSTTYADIIENAGTVIWNGPMGVFEFPKFAYGTKSIALACGACRGTTIVGGGDSAAAIDRMGLEHMVTHVSTGGGATLELLEGKPLPGLLAIEDVEV